MYDRLIIGSSDEERRDSWFAVAEILRDQLRLPEADVIACAHALQIEKLWRQNRQSRDLIILEADLGPDPRASADHGSRGGIEITRRLQAGLRPPACILVGHGLDILYQAKQWPLCEPLPCDNPTGPLLIDTLETLAKSLARERDNVAPAAGGAKKWALLEVHLAEKPFFSLRIGTGDRIEDRVDNSFFEVDPGELKSIVQDSVKLRNTMSERLRRPDVWRHYVEEWQADYASIGHRIFSMINKEDFPVFWGRAFQVARENTRLRFTLTNETYDGLWESMYDEKRREEAKWMMLQGTVTRRAQVQQYSNVRPLDAEDGTIHMLAIASNVEKGSIIEGPDASFSNLLDILVEPLERAVGQDWDAQDLFEDLRLGHDAQMDALSLLATRSHCRAGGPRLEIDILREVDDRPLRELVEERLTRGPVPAGRAYRYDVVHFAGHALFEEVKGANQRGFLMFGNHASRTEAVPISDFADWLNEANVQLAYLNCCRSSATRAAHELANSRVPLSIGFTWDLDGQGAIEFATAFYDHLLRNDAKVCQAFQYARKRLHRRYQGGNPIWTAPVLVAQPDEWDKVETCFARRREEILS